jgi:hypothetical protein
MPRLILPFLFLMHLPTSLVLAQGKPSLVPGATVRVVTLCEFVHHGAFTCPGLDEGLAQERTMTGEVVGMAGDTLRFRVAEQDGVLAIPLLFVTRLWVRDGSQGNAPVGAGLGLMGGALLGGLIGSTTQFCVLDCSPATGIGMVLGMPAGLILGAIIGSSIRSERWRPATLHERRVSVAPRLDTPGLAVRVRF